MKRFIHTPGGRMANTSLGIAITAAGALAWMGPGAHVNYGIGFLMPLLIVGCLFSVGLSIQDHGMHAFGLLLVLPFVGGPYLAALTLAPHFGQSSAIGILALGGLVTSWALLGGRGAERPVGIPARR